MNAALPPRATCSRASTRSRSSSPDSRPRIVERVSLQVDSVTRETVILEVGGIAETVSVVSETTHLNTTDASVGNVMSREQIRSLPVEAQNVVHLLSLQPGAIFIPTSNPATVDPRYGSVAGARADQQSVTLDGIDVNDPQMPTAYTSAIRMTQEALQEFRVSTSNYNAEMGRSSGPQVSLVTRSGTNQFDGSGYWTFRRTATSTNEYFLELSQKAAGQESKAPKLDKDIFGGSFGGPIQPQPAVLLRQPRAAEGAERSAGAAQRAVELVARRRADVSVRGRRRRARAARCAASTGNHTVPAGWYGMTPAEIAAIDPLGIGPSQAALHVLPAVPVAERSGPRRPQPDGLPLRGADRERLLQHRQPRRLQGRRQPQLLRARRQAGRHHQHRAAVRRHGPAAPAAVQQLGRRDRLRRGAVADADQQLPLRLHEDRREQRRRDQQQLRDVPVHHRRTTASAIDRSPTRAQTPTQNFVNDLSWFKGRHTMKAGTNIRFTRVPKNRFQTLVPERDRQPVVGGRHRPPQHAGQRVLHGRPAATCRRWPPAFQAGYADAWLNILGVLSQATQRANYNKDGTPQAPGTRGGARDRLGRVRVVRPGRWQLRPNLTLTAGVRYSLYSPPYEVNGLQVAPTISMGQWFDQRVANMKAGIPSSASQIVTFDLAGPKNNKPGFYAWDKNNFAPRVAVAWTPAERLVVRGGYSKVFDRVGVGLATNFDEGFAFGMSTQISSPFGGAYETNPGARFVNITTMPPTMPAAPPGGFPQTPPQRAGIITQSIDDTLVTPSAHMASAIVGFDLEPQLHDRSRLRRPLRPRHAGPPRPRDAAQPGRPARRARTTSPRRRRSSAPRRRRGITGNSPAGAYAGLPAMAVLGEPLPGAAGGGLTATQAITRAFMQNGPDWITALYDMDTSCSPACSKFGPVRVLRRTVRFARGDQLDRPLELQRHER